MKNSQFYCLEATLMLLIAVVCKVEALAWIAVVSAVILASYSLASWEDKRW